MIKIGFNMKNFILGLGIVIVFGLVLWQGIEAFIPSPEYDEYCSLGRFEGPYFPSKPGIEGETACSFSRELQEEQNKCYALDGQPVFEYDDNGCVIAIKECDLCNKEYNEAVDAHSKVVFIISLIVGIIVLFVGYGYLSVEPVGSALIGSGIWAIFWGSVVNWRNFSSVWRFLLLLLALVIIIGITLRLNNPKKKKGILGRVLGK
jgi:hypothetical protein